MSPSKLDFPDSFNVANMFIDRHLAEGRGDQPAIYFGDEVVSYGDLVDSVNRCGHALLARGLAPGDRVFMIMRDAPAFYYVFWGAIKAGLVPVPLNTLLRSADYRTMIETGAPRALIYSEVFEAEVEPICAGLIISTETDLLESLGSAPAELETAPASPTADCFWLFSSGSTGKPKAVVHRHRDMAVTSEYYGVGILGISPDDIFYSAAKLFFAYGLGNAMTFPLWVGGAAVLDPARPTPETTFANIERYRPTAFFGVPTLYAAQVHSFETAQPNMSSLRLCVSAGEALPADILNRWKESTGLEILDGIGSTEALHIFISNRPGSVVPGSSGRLVPGYEAKIVDEDQQSVPTGSAGRLMIRGPSTAAYYWQEPEKTAQTMRAGWLDTGDTYTCSADGIYTYSGRSDDMLKVGGIWCSPFEIESCLIDHDSVLEAAVVGRTDSEGLVKPAAFVVLANQHGAADIAAELQAHVKARLAPYKYPRWVTVVESLPKTATGKIQRFRLRTENV